MIIVNLPSWGYNTHKKNIPMNLFVSTKEFMNYEVGIQSVTATKPISWILMIMMIELGHDNTSKAHPGPVFLEIMHNTWKLKVEMSEPYQNGGHFKLSRANLMRPGLVGLNVLPGS